MVEQSLIEALKLLQKPVSRNIYSGKATTFFTFESIYKHPTEYADDGSTAIEHTLRVHLFSNKDYSDLLLSTMGVLEDAGFTVEGAEAELFEADTGFYHIPITLRMLEVKANG